MRDRRYVQDLTMQELEEELMIRRREERLARMRRLGAASRQRKAMVVHEQPEPEPFLRSTPVHDRELLGFEVPLAGSVQPISRLRAWREGILAEWAPRRAPTGGAE